ncbi:MAG: tetratricopeptide repeat protein, partial [Planctomycetota bacterium]
LGAEEILPFIPHAARIDQDEDMRLTVFARLFSEMVSVHNAATYVIEQNDWDFMGVYLDSIDHFGHAFMEYHPPRMEHVKEDDFEIYGPVMEGCYRFHDLMLGRLLEQAGNDTTVVLCSDHGFHSDHLRPAVVPREPAGPAIWHREYGIVVMAGPGIKGGERIYGASLLDIAPTILLLLGLPLGEDMDGKPLLAAIDHPVFPALIPSWEDVEGEAGMHPPDRRDDPYAAREAIRQLVDLGYIEEPDANEEKAAADTAREAKYNLARSYVDGGLLDEAERRLDELHRDHPDTVRFSVQLARVYMIQRRYDEARALARELLDTMKRLQKTQIERMDQLVEHIGRNRDEIVEQARRRWDDAHDEAVAAEAKKAEAEGREPVGIPRRAAPVDAELLDQRRDTLARTAERMRRFDAADTPQVNLMLGQLALVDRNLDEAIRYLGKAEEAEPRLPGLHLSLGQTYLRMRRADAAARAFRKALDIDGENAMAHEGLATALTRQHRHEDATDHALSAVELQHDMPRAHLRLGVTLARLELYEQAAEAFRTCLKLAPATPIAHRWLAALYRSKLGRADLADEHLRMAFDLRRAGAAPAADGPS